MLIEKTARSKRNGGLGRTLLRDDGDVNREAVCSLRAAEVAMGAANSRWMNALHSSLGVIDLRYDRASDSPTFQGNTDIKTMYFPLHGTEFVIRQFGKEFRRSLDAPRMTTRMTKP